MENKTIHGEIIRHGFEQTIIQQTQTYCTICMLMKSTFWTLASILLEIVLSYSVSNRSCSGLSLSLALSCYSFTNRNYFKNQAKFFAWHPTIPTPDTIHTHTYTPLILRFTRHYILLFIRTRACSFHRSFARFSERRCN